MKIDKDFYTSHIRDYEKLVKMNQVLDNIEVVMDRHIVRDTDFLDPYEIYLSKSILNGFPDISYRVIGGYENAERNILNFWPSYLQYEPITEEISSIKITNVNDDLSHKDFLGSILNLGIKREKIGDILVHETCSYIILKAEIKDFIIYNLEKIKNQKIELCEIPIEKIEIPQVKFKEISKFILSLRLDAVISAGYNLSRKDSMNLIESEQVKVNWENINKSAKEIKVGDVISVRRYGRIKLHEIAGYSKKGRLRCIIRILI